MQLISPENLSPKTQTECRISNPELAAVDWEPDGQTVAISSNCGVLVFDAGFVHLAILSIEDERRITTIAFNQDGTLVAASVMNTWHARNDDVYETRIWDVSTGELRQVFPHTISIMPIAWHPTENLLVIANDLELEVLDVDRGESLYQFSPPVLPPFSNDPYFVHHPAMACWSPEGSYIRAYWEVAGYLITVPQWEAASIPSSGNHGSRCNVRMTLIADAGAGVSDFVDHVTSVQWCNGMSADWNPIDDQEFAVNCNDRTVRIYDQNAELIRELESDFEEHSILKYARSLAYSPDGTRLIALGSDGTLRVWETDSYTLTDHVNVVEVANAVLLSER